MAESSFDIEAGVTRQDVDDAINQAYKEIANRYDFKGTESKVEWHGEEGILVESVSDERAKAVWDVLETKLIRRNVSLKAVEASDPKPIGGGRSKIDITLVTAMPPEVAKEIVKIIKTSKLKVTPTNMGDKVRVASKSRDALQEAMQLVKEADLDAPLTFGNRK